MTPTPKLRFVERVIAVPATDGEGRTVHVLQQWWQVASTGQITTNGEWRDVPVEKEL